MGLADKHQRIRTKLKFAGPILVVISVSILISGSVLIAKLNQQSEAPVIIVKAARERSLATSAREAAVGLLNARDSKSGSERLQTLRHTMREWNHVHQELVQLLGTEEEVPDEVKQRLRSSALPRFDNVNRLVSTLVSRIENEPTIKLDQLKPQVDHLEQELSLYLFFLDHLDLILAYQAQKAATRLQFVEGGLILLSGLFLFIFTIRLIIPAHSTIDSLINSLSESIKEKDELNQQLEEKVALRTKELSKAKQIAESANKAKSTFIANISHEIRTPLNAIIGFSDLLTDSGISPSERKHYARIISSNGDLLLHLISDVIELSKLEVGKLEIHEREVGVKPLIEEVLETLRPEGKQKGLLIKDDLKDINGLSVVTDPYRLKQILLNIVGNAIKFTEHGWITVSSYEDFDLEGSRKLAIKVEDTGPGLTFEQAQNLFQLFSQADSSVSRRFGGAGLGLIISKRLANALGGDVVLEKSIPGKGSTFLITIDSLYHRVHGEKHDSKVS